MKRLKHPIRSLKEPFGKAGLTVAVIALVFALIGGAYAAGGLTKSQEKQVTKIAKKYAGKPGAAGPAGAAGAIGPAGPAGAAGKNGTNGKPGEDGKEGSPWTAGGTLPKGKTEMGTWSVLTIENFLHNIVGNSSISFGIPLISAPTLAYVNAAGEEGLFDATSNEFKFVAAPVNCLGAYQEPQAKEGFLCLYVDSEIGVSLKKSPPNTIPAGAIVSFEGLGAGAGAQGSWALTSSE